MIGDVWFRFVDIEYWGDGKTPDRRIIAAEWVVVKETDKTVSVTKRGFVGAYERGEKWVKPRVILKNARRRFAYPTKDLALSSYLTRKKWQIRHAEKALARANACLTAAVIAEALLERDL